jgi:hypothetical protein
MVRPDRFSASLAAFLVEVERATSAEAIGGAAVHPGTPAGLEAFAERRAQLR